MATHKNTALILTLTIDDLRKIVKEVVKVSLKEYLKQPTPLEVYPIKEGAKMLGVHLHTLRLYAEKGIIQSFKIGNRQYLTLEAIQAFIEKGGSTKPTQPRAYQKTEKKQLQKQ